MFQRSIACALLIPVLILGACKDLTSLDQQSPTRIAADGLYTPANAQLLMTGAIGDFECALASYIATAGLISDELADSQTIPSGWDLDRRTLDPTNAVYAFGCGSTPPGMYTPVSVARYTSDRILTVLKDWTDEEVPNRQDLIAQAAAYAGYSFILLGEGMCTAAVDEGPELSRAELQALAEDRLTQAITAATAAGDSVILNMARVGRARSLLDQSRFSEALTDAALVPDGFVMNATYSQANTRRENLVNTLTYRSLAATVEPVYRNLNDPRVQVIDAGVVGADHITPNWRPAKYPTPATPIPIATWREARLIEAEAALAAGSVQPAVDAINVLHANAGIAPYGGGTAAEVMDQLKEERRRELFLEGQRLNDEIRFNVMPAPAPGSSYSHGGSYGTQLCSPLPNIERDNNATLTPSAVRNP